MNTRDEIKGKAEVNIIINDDNNITISCKDDKDVDVVVDVDVVKDDLSSGSVDFKIEYVTDDPTTE